MPRHTVAVPEASPVEGENSERSDSLPTEIAFDARFSPPCEVAWVAGLVTPYLGPSVLRGTYVYEQAAGDELGLGLRPCRCREFLRNGGRRPRRWWQQLWQPRIAHLFEPAGDQHGAERRSGRKVLHPGFEADGGPGPNERGIALWRVALNLVGGPICRRPCQHLRIRRPSERAGFPVASNTHYGPRLAGHDLFPQPPEATGYGRQRSAKPTDFRRLSCWRGQPRRWGGA